MSKKLTSDDNSQLNKTENSTTRQLLSYKHKFEANHKYFIISIYAFFVVLISTISIYAIWHFNIISSNISNFIDMLSSFVIAFFIAYFMNPLVKLIYNFLFVKLFKIKNEHKGKILSILIAYLFTIALIVLLIIFVMPQLIISISDLTTKLSEEIPDIYKEINDWFIIVEKKFPIFDWKSVEKQFKNSIPQVLELTTNFVTYLFEKIINISISLVSAFFNLLISIMVSVYMIMDKKILVRNGRRFLFAIFPKNKAISFCKTIKDCNDIFYNFVIGKAIDSLIIGIITFISMSLLKLDFTLLISLIVGITNMIPYFGPFIGAIPGIIILLIVEPLQGLIFFILIIVIQQFDGLYLGPKILGNSVGIKPLWVIFGITIGGAYWGPFGMFIGVPLVAIITYLINKLITYLLIRKNITLSDIDTFSNKK